MADITNLVRMIRIDGEVNGLTVPRETLMQEKCTYAYVPLTNSGELSQFVGKLADISCSVEPWYFKENRKVMVTIRNIFGKPVIFDGEIYGEITELNVYLPDVREIQ